MIIYKRSGRHNAVGSGGGPLTIKKYISKKNTQSLCLEALCATPWKARESWLTKRTAPRSLRAVEGPARVTSGRDRMSFGRSDPIRSLILHGSPSGFSRPAEGWSACSNDDILVAAAKQLGVLQQRREYQHVIGRPRPLQPRRGSANQDFRQRPLTWQGSQELIEPLTQQRTAWCCQRVRSACPPFDRRCCAVAMADLRLLGSKML